MERRSSFTNDGVPVGRFVPERSTTAERLKEALQHRTDPAFADDLEAASEALREGIRLLIREAAEVSAAEEIRRFYGDQPASLPEGVTPATTDELAAVDAQQW